MVDFPVVQWIRQDSSVDPSGSRHLLSGAAGFIRELGTVAGQELNFGTLNTTGSGAITSTALVYARVDDFGDASGVFNMKVFLTNTSAWGVGSYRFLERKTLHFVPNLTLDSSAENTPTVVPLNANLLGTITEPEFPSGKPWMSGVQDNDVSQYVYLALEAGANIPVGTYGGAGLGTYRYRILFDFS